jgi:hypothetical protein
VETKRPFEIDLADLDSIKGQIPGVEAKVEEIREEVRMAQREFAYWSALLDRLRVLTGATGQSSKAQPKRREPNAIELVSEVVNDSAVPLRAADVAGRITKPLERKTINWALWKAADENRIQRVGQGVYAPLSFKFTKLDELLLEGADNGTSEASNEPDSPLSRESSSGEDGG